jgi:hypothetical protein
MSALFELAMVPVTLLTAFVVACFALEIAFVLLGIPLLIMNAMGRALGRAFRHAKVWERASSGDRLHQTAGAVGSRSAGIAGWLLGAYAGVFVVGLLALVTSTGLLSLLAAHASL